MPLTDKLDAARADYDVGATTARRLLDALKEQMLTVVAQNQIALAVPIETRVKTWESVSDKLERKGRTGKGLGGISDLAGMRLITLFQADVDKLDGIIRSLLLVSEAEDTASRLDESQFGYRSNHYICRIPAAWEGIPSYRGLGEIGAEIQVRTLPQHMWAAASHNLQYKREDSAPQPLRRSINRVSAILEVIDLEFTRILEERDSYLNDQASKANHGADDGLNVDNLSVLLSDIFPVENQGDDEDYDDLLTQLRQAEISDVKTLRDLLERGRDPAMESDRKSVERERLKVKPTERVERGVYYKHVGLAREALRAVRGELPGDRVRAVRTRRPRKPAS